ncbi:MtnX-like HAD-IB family phosphatase, partial [Peptococcaceae bacterium]|nr:MtnX-like HAD-IB family phosphatase [Peptococcaceae bacterium]
YDKIMVMMSKKIFFIDFDGTIIEKDAVNSMISKFCRDGWQKIGKLWEKGEITTEECANQIFELCTTTNINEIYSFLDTISIDSYFKKFVDLCESNNYPVFILSDGYEELIKYILNKNKIKNLKIYANRMTIKNNRFHILPMYKNYNCGKCGTCKRQLLNSLRTNNCQAVYIGDGRSDICVCRYADVLFAKNYLWQYCKQNSIPAIQFNNFHDIINWAFKIKQ